MAGSTNKEDIFQLQEFPANNYNVILEIKGAMAAQNFQQMFCRSISGVCKQDTTQAGSPGEGYAPPRTTNLNPHDTRRPAPNIPRRGTAICP